MYSDIVGTDFEVRMELQECFWFSISKAEGVEAAIATFAQNIYSMSKIQYDDIGNTLMEIAKQSKEIAACAKLLSDKLAEKLAEKSAESAEV